MQDYLKRIFFLKQNTLLLQFLLCQELHLVKKSMIEKNKKIKDYVNCIFFCRPFNIEISLKQTQRAPQMLRSHYDILQNNNKNPKPILQEQGNHFKMLLLMWHCKSQPGNVVELCSSKRRSGKHHISGAFKEACCTRWNGHSSFTTLEGHIACFFLQGKLHCDTVRHEKTPLFLPSPHPFLFAHLLEEKIFTSLK